MDTAEKGAEALDLALTAQRLRVIDLLFGDPRNNEAVPGILLATGGADAEAWMERFAAHHGLPPQPGPTQITDDETLYVQVPARGPIRLVHGLEERHLDDVNDHWRPLAIVRQHVYLVLSFLPCPPADEGTQALLSHLAATRDQHKSVLVAVDLA